jgi:hypothetical protein
MGLMIYSLENIPISARRDFFIYLLDHGWQEPISDVLRNNFDRMAQIAAKNKAVIIKGMVGAHFENEVMSWHHINNEDAKELLPALLITNKHPQYFREAQLSLKDTKKIIRTNEKLKMILVPFKKFCHDTTEVITLIEKIFSDIEQQKDLAEFQIAREMNKGIGRAIVDSIILEPNISGIGFSFKKLKKFLKPK